MQKKREDYISRDEYFMWIAVLSGQRSKDPNTQVGACIVDTDKKIVWIWYNGLPTWCYDDEYPWERKWDFEDVKYSYVVHSEANAILNSFGKNLKWSTIYVTLFPCNECAKLIIQSGIKKVIYLSDKYNGEPKNNVSKRILSDAWVEFKQFKTEKQNISIEF